MEPRAQIIGDAEMLTKVAAAQDRVDRCLTARGCIEARLDAARTALHELTSKVPHVDACDCWGCVPPF